MIEVTYDAVLASAERAIQERGEDYVNPKNDVTDLCEYVAWKDGTGTPSCIAGYVLADLGMPMGDLSHYEGSSVRTLLTVERAAENLTCEKAAETFLVAFQIAQDDSTTWGASLREAKLKVKGVHGFDL